MKDLHVTSEVMDRFARGDLDDEGLSEVLHHLETCEACARAGENRVAGDLTTLRAGWTSEPVVRRRPRLAWTLAAAAAMAMALVAALLLSKQPPSPRDPGRTAVVPRPGRTIPPVPSTTATAVAVADGYEDPEWQRLVDVAVNDNRLPFPKDLDELTAPADTVRGGTGSDEPVAPAGVVVDDVRPVFTWPAREGGTYTVFIFEGDRKVLQSPPLKRPRWRADRDLPRGRTLIWQVEVTGLSTFETIPSPPSPPAMFRIVNETDHRDLVEARRRHGDNDLLLAVLYARNGMRAEALEALRRAAAGNDTAKRILDHETSAR